MRKRWTAVLAVLGLVTIVTVAGVAATPASASTIDSCVDFGRGQNNCFASTTETRVDFGQVRAGRYSIATFSLVCVKRGQVFEKDGRIRRAHTRSFFPEGLFGLRHPTCTLSAHFVSVVLNKRANGVVLLVS